jgi:hypothetical protein
MIDARLEVHSKTSTTTMVPQRHSGHVFREMPVSASPRLDHNKQLGFFPDAIALTGYLANG